MEMNLTAPLWLWILQTQSCTEGLVSSCLFHLLIMNKCHFTYSTKWFFMIEWKSSWWNLVNVSQTVSSDIHKPCLHEMKAIPFRLLSSSGHLPCCLLVSSWACKAKSQKLGFATSTATVLRLWACNHPSNWTSLSDNTGESVLLPLCQICKSYFCTQWPCRAPVIQNSFSD